MRTLAVKICGITRADDAELAISLGATHLGIIFAETSPRKVELTAARDIATKRTGTVKFVGVFQNQDSEYIATVRTESGLDLVQLHGDESAMVVSQCKPALKAITDLQTDNKQYAQQVEALVFDRPKGSEMNAETWFHSIEELLAEHEPTCSFFVAGGINAENAVQIVSRFSRFKNFMGIDVASGIESSPGIKDHNKMRSLFRALKEEAGYAISR